MSSPVPAEVAAAARRAAPVVEAALAAGVECAIDTHTDAATIITIRVMHYRGPSVQVAQWRACPRLARYLGDHLGAPASEWRAWLAALPKVPA